MDGTVTANLSATDNAVLDAIQAAVELIDNAISGTEMQVDVLTMPTVTIQDGGNTITVDGTIDLGATDNAVLDSIQAAVEAIQTAVEGTLTVSGTVDLGATDNAVLDTIETNTDYGTVTGGGAELGALRVTIANDSTGLISIDDGGNTITVDGTVDLGATDNAVLDAIQAAVEVLDDIVAGSEAQVDIVSGTVDTVTSITNVVHVDDNAGSLTVDGTVTAELSATDNTVLDNIDSNTDYGANTGGGVELGALRVTIANDSTGLISIDDNGGSITVDGEVTANLSATDNAVLDAIQTAVEVLDNAIAGTEMQVDVVAALPAGDNNIGNVDIASAIPAGTNVVGKVRLVTANGDEITEDTDDSIKVTLVADDVGIGGGTQYDEDAAHTTGDTGTMSLAVRNDTLAALTDTDGDYTPLQVDAQGALFIQPVDSGGTAITETTDHSMNVTIVADDAGIGGGTQYDEDDAVPANPTGTAVLAERDDALGGLTPAEGDWTQLRTDANGALWTHDDALDAAISGSELQVDVVGALPAGDNNIGNVDVASIAAGDNNIGNVDIVSGTVDTVTSITNDVNIADGGNVISVDDGAGSLTVDGTVTAELSATDNAVLDAIDSNTDFGAQVGGGTEADALRVTIANNSTGVLSVDDGGGALTVDGTVTAELSATDNAVLDTIETNTDFGAVVGGGAEATALRVTLANDSTGVVSVDDGGGALTVDGTVTANLSATDNAVLDNIDADTTDIKTAVEIIDNAISGSEMQVDVVASLPAGTNAIGKLAANSGVDIGDVDVTSISAGTNNIGSVMPYAQVGSYVSGATSDITDTTATSVIAAQGAGVVIYVTTLMVSNSHASVGTVVNITDGSGGTTKWTGYAGPLGGGFVVNFNVPLVLTANTALYAACETTGANVFVNATGFKV